MNFLAPLLLLGLLLVPVLAGLYVVVQRRRSRYAVRFTNLDLLANLAPRRPAGAATCRPPSTSGAVAALVARRSPGRRWSWPSRARTRRSCWPSTSRAR